MAFVEHLLNVVVRNILKAYSNDRNSALTKKLQDNWCTVETLLGARKEKGNIQMFLLALHCFMTFKRVSVLLAPSLIDPSILVYRFFKSVGKHSMNGMIQSTLLLTTTTLFPSRTCKRKWSVSSIVARANATRRIQSAIYLLLSFHFRKSGNFDSQRIHWEA